MFAVPLFALGTAVCSAASAPDVVADVSHVRGLSDLGRAPATARVSIAVMLAYRHQAELEQLVAAQADPASPLHDRYLTREQFAAYFAPSPADYARTANSLQQAGFRVARTYPNRTLIDAEAPVATAERYFDTEIHRVAQPGSGVRFANARPAHAPAALRGVVTGVVGLDDLARMHTFNHRAPGGAGRANLTPRPDLAVPGRVFGPDLGYGPTAYIAAYDFPSTRATGKGQVTAVVIDADFLDSDLASYLAYFGIARSGPPTVRVPIDGGPPPGLGSPDSVETTLDVETIVGLAPGTSLYVYEFPSFANNQYILDAYEQVVIDDFAGTVNSSFGGCEETFGDNFPQLSDQIALQGAALGITFHASTGDAGNLTFGCSSTSVSAPASDPHFVAVGGTSLYADPASGATLREFGWSGSGGGTSVVAPEPAYQRGIAHVIPSGRNLPDVAFDADPSTGTSFYYGGAFVGPLGGTSLSSPIFGAGLTLANQLRGAESGFVNPSLYATFKKYGYAARGKLLFRDITLGNNGFYTARPGYDQVTGIGAMQFSNLASYLR